jgi:hypothetical protein
MVEPSELEPPVAKRPRRRVRRVLLVALAIFLVAFASALLVPLPFIGKPLIIFAGTPFAVSQLRAALGRPVALDDVDLRVFRLQVTATGLAVAEPDGRQPFAGFTRLDIHLRILPLLWRRLIIRELTLVNPRVRIVRTGPATFNVSDLLPRGTGGSGGGGRGFDYTIERVTVVGGVLAFEDRTVSPPRVVEATDLRLELRDVSTTADTAAGTATLAFTLAGAPVTLAADGIRGSPAQARARLEVPDLDLARLFGGAREGDRLVPERGVMATRLALTYDEPAGARLDGELTVRDLAVTRGGQDAPFVTVPALALSARGLGYRDGRAAAERLELRADPTVTDGRARFEVRPLHVVVEDASYPAAGPARVALSAALADRGALEARGTATLGPPGASLQVLLRGADVMLPAPYIPEAAPITPGGGRLDADLAIAYVAGTGLRADGDVRATDLVLRRRGQAEPLATHPRVTLAVRGVQVGDDGAVRVERLAMSGAPTLVDATATPPLRVELAALDFQAEDATWPARGPARVRLDARDRAGGSVAVAGTFDPTTLGTDVRATLRDLDLARAAGYFPADSPVTLTGGRLGARMRLVYGAPTLRLDGNLTVADGVLHRPGQAEPFVLHPELRTAIAGFTLRDGNLAIQRLAVSGTPTVLDTTVTPPVKAEFTRLALTAEGAAWPAGRPTRFTIDAAVRDGGAAELTGTFHPATLAADVRATLRDVDLARAAPYLPAGGPVGHVAGHGTVAATLRHDRATGLRLAADGAIEDVAVGASATAPPLLRDRRLGFRLDDLALKNGSFRIGKLAVTGAPALALPGGEPERVVALRGLALAVADVASPATGPGRVEVVADLPGAGTLAIDGTARLDTRDVDLAVRLDAATLAPYAPVLPFDTGLAGTATADLRVAGRIADGAGLEVAGAVRGTDLALGPPDRPVLSAKSLEASAIEIRWPAELVVGRLAVDDPVALVEREQDGTFPLRAMLRPRRAPPPPNGSSAPPAGAPEPGSAPDDRRPFVVRFGEIVLDDGDVRFVDHSTTPAYSEQLSRLALSLRGFSTDPDGRATLTAHGLLGATSALELRGELAPFARPFYLEVEGELREFQLPRTNPYFRRLFAWFLKRGSLTTRVHYRIVGDQLEAKNDLSFQRLGVERDRAATDADKKIGLPLGLIVAVATDSRGDLAFSLPVQGKLGSPEFSFGSAIWAGLKNALTNLVTGPFRAIGGLFRKGEEEAEEPRIDPVRFPPGAATVTAEAERHLQRVADFLRSSPGVVLSVTPVVGAADGAALRTQEVTARIQRVQREAGLADFGAAAARVFRETAGGQPVPPTADEIVEALRERLPLPEAAAADLAARRLAAARDALVRAAGVEAERLRPGDPVLAAEGDGRVEFALED